LQDIPKQIFKNKFLRTLKTTLINCLKYTVLYEHLIVYEYNYYIEKEYLGSMEILKLSNLMMKFSNLVKYLSILLKSYKTNNSEIRFYDYDLRMQIIKNIIRKIRENQGEHEIFL